ncbi:hypothetical protein VTJ04DRAFT_1541 [Mycothermus thermophilus]|uniref:uncharacterized protein n=1 Tax=Humicola insolens TaxID=85995 RepID=UPI00374499E3
MITQQQQPVGQEQLKEWVPMAGDWPERFDWEDAEGEVKRRRAPGQKKAASPQENERGEGSGGSSLPWW